MYIFKVLFVFSGLNLKALFTDLCVRWNLHSEIGLNEKKDKMRKKGAFDCMFLSCHVQISTHNTAQSFGQFG